jgi:hypothetical protein
MAQSQKEQILNNESSIKKKTRNHKQPKPNKLFRLLKPNHSIKTKQSNTFISKYKGKKIEKYIYYIKHNTKDQVLEGTHLQKPHKQVQIHTPT